MSGCLRRRGGNLHQVTLMEMVLFLRNHHPQPTGFLLNHQKSYRRMMLSFTMKSAYIDTAASTRARSSSSQPVQMMPDEEIDRRVQAGIEERLQQMTADFETRMAGLVRAELAKMMPNLPPEFRPPTRPPCDDDDTSAV